MRPCKLANLLRDRSREVPREEPHVLRPSQRQKSTHQVNFRLCVCHEHKRPLEVAGFLDRQ
eukprot:1240620-Prymnesium_polylepis.4